MADMISHNSSQTRVHITYTGKDGETLEQDMYIPKTQKDGYLSRVWERNPHLASMVVTAKNGKIIFERRR